VFPPKVDVVVPGAWSSDGLAATLASLASQRYPAFSVVSARPPTEPAGSPIPDICAILEARGHAVRIADLPPGLTSGQRRQMFLEDAKAPYVLVVDDDVFLEPDLLGRMVAAIRTTRCGLVGSAAVDLRYRSEHRPSEQVIEFWDGPVRPEEIGVGSRAWARRRVHRGANLEHLRERLPRTRDRLYRIADIRGCVLYDVAALRAAGGFAPIDRGRRAAPVSLEASAQLRVLARNGGAGLFPSGTYRLTSARGRTGGRRDALNGSSRDRDGGRWIRRTHLRRRGAAEPGQAPGDRQMRAPGHPHRHVARRPAGGRRDA
jgi:hypothetical protein